jgi:hypothetical protein
MILRLRLPIALMAWTRSEMEEKFPIPVTGTVIVLLHAEHSALRVPAAFACSVNAIECAVSVLHFAHSIGTDSSFMLTIRCRATGPRSAEPRQRSRALRSEAVAAGPVQADTRSGPPTWHCGCRAHLVEQ